jgi:two-component system, NtrC family, sensor kinase
MRLRTKTILLVFFFVALAAISLSVASRYYIYPKFIQLEDEQAIRNANIGLELLNNEVDSIADRPADWGYWDDIYQFIQHQNDEFVQSNLEIESQVTLAANLIAIYDRNGKKIWSRAMRLDTKKSFRMDEYENHSLPLTHPLLSHEDIPYTRAGLMNSSHGPIFLASTPILYSNRTGPSVGTIIFGRLFEPEKIRHIATQAGLELKLSPHPANMSTSYLPTIDSGSGRLQHTPLKIVRTNKTTQVQTTLFSIDGKPSIDMSVSMSSDISQRGLKTLDAIIVAIGIAGLLLSLVLTYMLNRSVTTPISQITQHLTQIGCEEDISKHIRLNRDDEIGDLANAFDEMLQRLNDTRKRLFEQSYQTGAAEIAQDVIQDINKGIQPLRENIELPISLLDKAHTSTGASLIHELADTKLDKHRFIEITQQLLDLNNEQALTLAEARSEMRRLRINLEQLQEVIGNYSKFVSQGTEFGPVPVANLLDNALKKLNSDERKLLLTDIDASVYRAAPVAASQSILQQVLNVLIEHFASASEKSGTSALNLRVSCRTEMVRGNAHLHFCFDDDRPHLNKDEFQTYLQENWTANDTTKASGLPWAETAITAMLGKLYAEPSQLLQGIAIHLILPRAKLDGN